MKAKVKILNLKSMIDALTLIASIEDPRQQNQAAKADKHARSWKFKEPGKVRYNLARSFRALSDASEAFEIARAGAYKAAMTEQVLIDPESTNLTGRFMADYQDEINTMVSEDIEIDVRPVTVDMLDLEANDIPFTAIAPLLDSVILDQLPNEEKP